MRKGESENFIMLITAIFSLCFGAIVGSIIGNYIWVVFVNYYYNNL